jgi:DnaJ-class molecular chaperone
MATNPYKALGVDPGAKQDDIKTAYRKLAKSFHPDLNPGDKKAEARFKEVASAYDLIGNKDDRAKFDRGEQEVKEAKQNSRRSRGRDYNDSYRAGSGYSSQFEGMDQDAFSSIFEQMNRRPPQGETYQLEVEFSDSILGAERELTFPNGTKVSVKIPAGVQTGAKLRFAGKGNLGADAYVQLTVMPSEVFRRVGKNLELDLSVSFADAILGHEVNVPTIDGSVLMKLPNNLKTDQKIRVKGKGVGAVGSPARGDLIATLKIQMPLNVDDEFRKAVEALNERHILKESII